MQDNHEPLAGAAAIPIPTQDAPTLAFMAALAVAMIEALSRDDDVLARRHAENVCALMDAMQPDCRDELMQLVRVAQYAGAEGLGITVGKITDSEAVWDARKADLLRRHGKLDS